MSLDQKPKPEKIRPEKHALNMNRNMNLHRSTYKQKMILKLALEMLNFKPKSHITAIQGMIIEDIFFFNQYW